MVAAIEVIEKGGMSINKVADLHGVPRTMLKNCLEEWSMVLSLGLDSTHMRRKSMLLQVTLCKLLKQAMGRHENR